MKSKKEKKFDDKMWAMWEALTASGQKSQALWKATKRTKRNDDLSKSFNRSRRRAQKLAKEIKAMLFPSGSKPWA